MSDNSAIEWTDATWNPVTGCTKVSPGCDNCYADTFSERWRGIAGHYFENGFDIQLRPDKLTVPLAWKKPRRVFVNSMSDLFHKDIPDEYIAKVFAVMALTPQHTYQVLTKRHGRMRSLLNDEAFRLLCEDEWSTLIADEATPLPRYERERKLTQEWSDFSAKPLPNVWLGVSVEDQKRADLRIPALLDTPAAVRFLSCEPLLGPVDLGDYTRNDVYRCRCGAWERDGQTHPLCAECGNAWAYKPGASRIDWVIVGGESGRGARPMDPTWATRLVQQCQHSNVPVFVKQLGSRWSKQHKDIDQFPAELRVRQFPETAAPALS